MSPADDPKAFKPPPAPSEGAKDQAARAAEPPARPVLLAFTIDAATGQVVTIEGVGPAGEHRELSDEARASLAERTAQANLQAVVEEAFEAGIDCVLGGREASPSEAAPTEAEEEVKLRRLLLASLIERSAAKRLIQREVLGPAIVGTLIAHAAAARGPIAGPTVTH